MGQYIIQLTDEAKADLKKHKKVGNKATLTKINKIFEELENHPFEGIGHPEPLKYELFGFWSRRINQKDRIVYQLIDKTIVVEVVSAIGHYGDK